MTNERIVVKVGGGANVVHAPLLDELSGREPLVLVHGFSAAATTMGERLDVPPEFVTSPGGHRSRFTDDATLEVVHLAARTVNERLAAGAIARGHSAVGVLAGDVGVRAVHKDALRVVTDDGRVLVRRGDRSGRVTDADATVLDAIVAAGSTPVVAPLGRTKDGDLASLDGDRCAAALAGAVGADTLVILTGVPGVLRNVADPTTRIGRLSLAEIDESAAFIEGAMKRKVLAAREALEAGVGRVLIGPADAVDPIRSALEGDATEVVP